MNILLDECVPRKFKNSFSGHDCRTVPVFIRTPSSRLADLLPLVPDILKALHSIRPGGLVKVG